MSSDVGHCKTSLLKIFTPSITILIFYDMSMTLEILEIFDCI